MNLEESRLDNLTAHHVNLDICKAFFKRHLLKGNLLICMLEPSLTYVCVHPLDPAFQCVVPDLDGSDGHCEHIIFGTNLDLSDEVQAADSLASRLPSKH